MSREKIMEMANRMYDIRLMLLDLVGGEEDVDIIYRDLAHYVSRLEETLKILPLAATIRRAAREVDPDAEISVGVDHVTVVGGEKVIPVRQAVGAALGVSLWEKKDRGYHLSYVAKVGEVMVSVIGLPPSCRIEWREETITQTVAHIVCDNGENNAEVDAPTA